MASPFAMGGAARADQADHLAPLNMADDKESALN
jgi:hypothetical protein